MLQPTHRPLIILQKSTPDCLAQSFLTAFFLKVLNQKGTWLKITWSQATSTIMALVVTKLTSTSSSTKESLQATRIQPYKNHQQTNYLWIIYVFPLPPGTYWKYPKLIWLLMRFVCFLHDRPSQHLPCTQDSCIKKGAGWTPGRNKIKYENILVPVPGWGCWHFRGTKRLVFFIQAAGLSAKWHPSKPIIMFHLKSANASRFVWLAFA